MQIHRNVKQEDVGLFVEKVFAEKEDLIRIFFASMRSGMNEGIYLVENVNRMVVAASTHSTIWHPHCVYVRLAFNLNCIDDRAIQFMIEFLKDEVEKPLFFLIDNRFRGLDELLTRKDFRLIRKTEVININPEIFLSVKDDSDQEIITAGQILNDPVLLSSLIEICKKTYTETHIDNPVADLSTLSWKNVIFNDLIDSSSYVVVNENNVIAFSLMYGGEENSWELGWIGVANSDEMTLLNLVLNRQLRDAKEQKITYIEKEVDSTCPYSLHIAKLLSYDVSETWYSYVQT